MTRKQKRQRQTAAVEHADTIKARKFFEEVLGLFQRFDVALAMASLQLALDGVALDSKSVEAIDHCATVSRELTTLLAADLRLFTDSTKG